MSTFLDDLLKKMKTAPHVGVPQVTNPKRPTKVERDAAEYAARQKAMPNFKFGTGTPLERLQTRMVSTPHPTPTFADPAFSGGSNGVWQDERIDVKAYEDQYQKLVGKLNAKKSAQESYENDFQKLVNKLKAKNQQKERQ